MSIESDVTSIIQAVLKHKGINDATVDMASRLYEDGLGLDSLSVAELSASLEKSMGKDPYTAGQLPQTVSDIVAFYSVD